ncbi:MAG TPA: nitronate monooxygenase [Chloroflexi bacterium]|jgi:nitronate monooxygenase/enoyl-[acyl-carrier protein] reductase II|nr:nitronate monooxygenase [Chloroflexota bacterium]
MLRTPLCDLLKIDAPIIQAPMGGAATGRLAAAASNSGILGSIAALRMSADTLRDEIEAAHERTNGSFAVNHGLTIFDEEAFQSTLDARPAVISFALGDPGDLVARAHAAGAVVIQQVVTVRAAVHAARNGVDIIVAQGTESGGNTGMISTLELVPLVVDAVWPVPVVAAGGIADGRGVAAALSLGAQGVNLGTRFLASREAEIAEGWKEMIVAAGPGDIMKLDAWNAIFPPAPGDYATVPSVIRTPFAERVQAAWRAGTLDTEEMRREIAIAAVAGRQYELVAMAGQSVGMIDAILPVNEIVPRIVAETVDALRAAGAAIVTT